MWTETEMPYPLDSLIYLDEVSVLWIHQIMSTVGISVPPRVEVQLRFDS
jgi:hypothetical protein